MAKIKMGALMTDIRGSAGGSVFARNGGGAYMRNKVTPLNPQSTEQSNVRSLFGQISQAWSQLTPEEREGFNNSVDSYGQPDVLGDEQVLPGKALFQMLNQNLLLAGQSQINQVPLAQEVQGVFDPSAEFDNSAGTLNIDTSQDITSGFLFVYATEKVTAGTSFVKNKLRLLRVEPQFAGPVDVLSDYEARFGAVAPDDRIAFGFRVIADNGQNGPLSTIFMDSVNP